MGIGYELLWISNFQMNAKYMHTVKKQDHLQYPEYLRGCTVGSVIQS